MPLKLGKLAPRAPRLRLRPYITHLTPPPASAGTYDSMTIDAMMLGNDAVGDCAVAGPYHESIHWNWLNGRQHISANTELALQAYSDITGYTPDDPSTDTGCVVADVVDYRRKTGLLMTDGKRHKLAAGLGLDRGDTIDAKQSINLFDAVGIGFQVPDYAMEQFNAGQPWDLIGTPEEAMITGGHYVAGIAYDPQYVYVITWGAVQRMSWGFYKAFADEAWAYVAEDLLNDAGKSPDGFDLAKLKADLALI